MKRLAIACSALFFLSFHAAAQTYFSCDFSNGIPSDFTLVDGDGNEPSVDAAAMGFAVGVPWIATTPTSDANMVACATSWYTPAGTSNDWLITPAFAVGHEGAALTWRSRSRQRGVLNAYSVYAISGTDTTQLFTSAAEPVEWTNHSVSLAAYVGQTVKIAFVENSTDKSYLFVDDIVAGVYSAIQVKSTMNGKTALTGDVDFNGIVVNAGQEPIYGYSIDVNGTQVQFPDTLQVGEQKEFTIPAVLQMGKHTTVPYTLTATSGSHQFVEEGAITSYQRKVVVEELTGTWCAWCVRGFVLMQQLRHTAADHYIGIAVHSDDVMANEYETGLAGNMSWSGLPCAVVGRSFLVDIPHLEAGINASLSEETTHVAIDPVVETDFETGQIKVVTNLVFGEDNAQANYRLAYSLIEDNVHHPDDSRYTQNNNAYTNNNNGEMGGWEKLPVKIPAADMWFHEVARYYDGDYNGNAELPAAIVAEQPIAVERTIDVPAGRVDTLRNCSLVVMVIDGTDNRIVNGEICHLDPNAPAPVDVAQRWIAAHTTAIKGDLNGDGVVDSTDVTELVSVIIGTADATEQADLNGDGSIDASDLSALIALMLGASN